MAPTVQTLNSVNYSVSVYAGLVIIITGLGGNIIDILVFTQLKLFRSNQSVFYLTMAAIVECYLLFISTCTRVAAQTSGYDPTQTSIIWCKFRIYLIQLGSTLLPIIICLSAIDQYLSTSYHIHLRQISTFKLAQRLIAIFALFAALYSISFPIFQDIQPTLGCTTYNASYNYYYSFVHLCIIIGVLPIVISSVFSLLSFRNVRRIVRRQIPIVRRRLDRQLTAMILVRVALFVTTALPFVSVRAYQIEHSVNPNDPYAVAVNQLIKTTVTTFYNLNYSCSCYIFLSTSARFRRQVKYLFTKKLWQKLLSITTNRNEVVPVNQQQIAERRVSAVEAE